MRLRTGRETLKLFFPFLFSAILAFGPPLAHAQNPITIKSVRLGFAPGPASQAKDENNQPRWLFKAANWTPVWVDLEVTGPIQDETIDLVVATPDGDDVITRVRLNIPRPPSGSVTSFQLSRIPYLKPGGITAEVSVDVQTPSGRPLAQTFQQRLTALPPARYLILSVGAALPGLRLPKNDNQTGGEPTPEGHPLRHGWVELAQVTDVAGLPDRWFGYDGVDLMILCTGSEPAFWKALANDARRLNALSEWVQRGGRVVIGVGKNPEVLNANPQLAAMLPAKFLRSQSISEIALELPNSPRLILKAPAANSLMLSSLGPIPGRPYQIKLLADERDDPPPLVVQGAYGLGRVTLVAFDLDFPPLADWPQREAFWDWLINIASTRLPNNTESPGIDSRAGDEEDKYLERMRYNLDFFEGVPVISFGWVALLILGYILLVGPLEYLVLKRLLKRMELTWLTLPIIVATVCASAYLGAIELKGRDLKVNKVDLVDIDQQGNRVYGHCWFTVFSPRNHDYTIGIEPRAEWDGSTESLVSWHGKAKNTRQSLFRRTYTYHSSSEPDVFADGLERVPIQIWSTKSFTAAWSGKITEPLIQSTLRIAEADPNQITGSITSLLPVDSLSDVQLFYRNHVTPVPALVRGIPRYLSTSSQARPATAWLHDAITQKDLLPTNRSGKSKQADANSDPDFRLWPLLFHDLVQGQAGRLYNASFRNLDQSWRVAEKNPNEAILVARIGRSEGPAEEMSASPASPTRLWLNELPGSGPRTPFQGTIRQETYIRVFIPILPARK
ncbi:MAG: hypothetical protein K8T89_21780 [Planctomycetes bacterium]|nr:hypothetical protein [Planctomycetota bacterium]